MIRDRILHHSRAFRSAAWQQLLLGCTVASPGIAWLVASYGFGLPTSDPLRDLPLLVLGAAAEEIVFRGGLQVALAQRYWGQWRWMPVARLPWLSLTSANLITGVIFALMHLWRHPAPAALAVLPVSLLLGLSFEWSGRLRIPIMLHLWFNVSLWAASFLMRP
ncbi:CAAX amino terminal protease family [Leptothrix ochracea L12]|uniref:CAAX amino terminal protease family n=1 Tax=Leptothrix ochracea L12 TaxID=735332 RepID=I4Z5Y7_9BURK|nr:JDVT-CTERM system glutamic-type intramembrane protease [Leptothrix ochracea]EIM31629.1 CAAX amino terminal protease family [Leptothrix ochracea L12]